MAARRNKNHNRLVLLTGGWTKTMRLVVTKHVLESSPDRNNPWSLDDFLDKNELLVKKALAGQAVKLRRKLNRPTDIEQWDVTLICLILLEVCYWDPLLQSQYQRLQSDVKYIRKIRNELSHGGIPEIDKDSFNAKFSQIQEIIIEGLEYVNDQNSTETIKTFIDDVATGDMVADEAGSVYREWYDSEKQMEGKLDHFSERQSEMMHTLNRMEETFNRFMNVPDTTIDLNIQANDESTQKKAEDIMITVFNSDITNTTDLEEQQHTLLSKIEHKLDNASQEQKKTLIKALCECLNKFEDDGKKIKRANAQCVLLKIKCPTFKLLYQLWKDCVNGVVTALFIPVQEALQMIDGFDDVVFEVIVRESEFWRCMDIVVSDVSELASRTGVANTEISATAAVGDRIIMTVQPRSIENLHHISEFCKSGRLNENLAKVSEAMKQALGFKELNITATLRDVRTLPLDLAQSLHKSKVHDDLSKDKREIRTLQLDWERFFQEMKVPVDLPKDKADVHPLPLDLAKPLETFKVHDDLSKGRGGHKKIMFADDDYFSWGTARQNTIKTLRELADLIDELKQVGSMANTVWSIVKTVGAFFLAFPFSGAVAAAGHTVGGIMSHGSTVGLNAQIKSVLTKAQVVIDVDRKQTTQLLECAGQIFNSRAQFGTIDALRIGVDDLAALGSASTAAMVVNVDSLIPVLDLILVPFDITTLVSNAFDVHKKTPHETAENIRKYVDGLEFEYKNLKGL